MSKEYKNEELDIINHTSQITHHVSPITHYRLPITDYPKVASIISTGTGRRRW